MKFVINRTIGILFSTVKEYSFTQMLAELFQPLMQSPHLPVITFSLPNVDLTAKSVCGTCISGGKQEAVQADLPAIIFNFSFQYKKEGVRRLRALAESSTLLNATNRYHQLPVMEMLRCDEATKGYLLPFSAQDAAAFRRQGSRLLLPQSSASLSKITYCECTAGDCAIYTPFSSRSCTSAEATASLESISQSEQTLLLDAPKLQSGRKGLFTVRYFLQKRFDGSWDILTADTPRAAAQQGFEANEA
ncbi:MAG: hypothetical protein P4M02_07805, partial [Clostridia bacterium]|nr:hypothetical protein [Clostridia bacterium]